MKNIKTQNRTRPNLKPALFAICLALLAATPAISRADNHDGNAGHASPRRSCFHAIGKTSGLRVDWTSWLRRWIPI